MGPQCKCLHRHYSIVYPLKSQHIFSSPTRIPGEMKALKRKTLSFCSSYRKKYKKNFSKISLSLFLQLFYPLCVFGHGYSLSLKKSCVPAKIYNQPAQFSSFLAFRRFFLKSLFRLLGCGSGDEAKSP